MAGRINRSAHDLAKCRKAHIAGTGSPYNRLDLLILLSKAELECISAVIDDHDFVKVCTDKGNHIFLGLSQLQIVLACLEIVVFIGVLRIRSLGHILRNVVVAFTRHSGNDNDRCVRVCLRAVDQFARVVLCRGLRQIPVLGRDGNGRSVLSITLVEIDQFLVDLKPRVLKAVDQAHDREQCVHSSGSGSAVNRVCRCPSEQVQLVCACKRKQVLFVLQENEAFFRDPQRHIGSLLSGLICHLSAAGRQCDQCVHRAEADHVDYDRDACDHCDPGFFADQ